MPVSQEIVDLRRELDRLYERLDQFEQDTAEMVASSYLGVLQERIRRVESQIAEAERDEDGHIVEAAVLAAAVRSEMMEGRGEFRSVWEDWQERLIRIDNFVYESLEMTESLPGGSGGVSKTAANRKFLSGLRGSWPEDGSVGTGIGGRMHNLSVHHRQQMANTATRRIFNGVNTKEVKEGLAERLEQAERQVDREVHDSTIEYSREVNSKKAEELGYEHFEYIGPMDKVTRPFCRGVLRNGPVFTREEIEAMSNGHGLPVMESGGGYECRHHWQQTRKRWYDDEEWEGMRGDRETLPQDIDEAEDEYRKDRKELREEQKEQATNPDVETETAPAVDRRGREKELHFDQTDREPDPGSASLEFDQGGHGAYQVGRYNPDLPEEDRRYALVDNWVHGSRRKSSVLAQEAARREFDLDARLQTPRSYRYEQADLDAARTDVSDIYERTQSGISDGRLERLRDNWAERDDKPDLDIFTDDDGTKKVRLYRGVAADDDFDPDDYDHGVMESWTADPDEALKHARRNAGDSQEALQLEEEVPVDRIFTHQGAEEWHDGYFGDQSEFVVMPEAP